jgi:hypothetical protein
MCDFLPTFVGVNHTSMENQKVIYVDTNELKPSIHHLKMYGDSLEIDPLFEATIYTEGVKEPLIITKSKTIISGVLRWKIASKILKQNPTDTRFAKLPVIITEEQDTPFNLALHNQNTTKSVIQRYLEYKALKKGFGIKQGYRSDLNNHSLKDLLKNNGISQSTISRLRSIEKHYSDLFPNQPDRIKETFSQIEKGETSITLLAKLLNTQTKELKLNEKSNCEYKEGKILLLNKSCEDLSDLPDKSVQCVISSPPYWKLRKYENGITELGQERTPELFINNLIKLLNGIKPKLKENGSVIINISDTIENGEQCLIPHLFVTGMKRNNWRVNSTIVWSKINPPYQDNSTRPCPSFEYIFQFYLNKKPNYSVEWLNQSTDDIQNIVYGDMKDPNKQKNLKSNWWFQDEIIETTGNHTQKLQSVMSSVGVKLTHSAMMSDKVAKILIKTFVRPGEGIVVDLFNGVNTIGNCIKELGNQTDFVGYEINKKYFNQSVARTKLVTTNQNNLKQVA